MKTPVIVLLFFALFAASCNKEEIKKEEKITKIPVRIEKVVTKSGSVPVRVNGKLSSSAEIKLSFLTGGIIDRIYVKEGQSVGRGRLLASLKTTEIDANVRKAENALEKSLRDFDRIENLYKDSVATLEQMQNTGTMVDVNKSNLDIARFNKKHSYIYAPARGKILKKLAEPGELCGPGNPVIIFGAENKGWLVKTGVSDKDVVKMKIGDSASVSFDAFPGVKFPGRINEIARAANIYNGAYEVEIKIDGLDYSLVSGFVADVTIFPSERGKYSLVPPESLVNADAGTGYVFVPDSSGKSRKIKVNIAFILDGQIGISSGLEGIKEVISDGAAYLKNGSEIKIIK